MSEKTKEVPQLADATYAHTLVIKSTHEYKVHGPYGFTMQTLSIHCILKIFDLFGFLRHYLLNFSRGLGHLGVGNYIQILGQQNQVATICQI